MKDTIKTSQRISVENVYVDYYRAGASQPDFTEKVIAFGIMKKGSQLVGITEDRDGREDYCERQRPQYELVYRGNS